MPEDLPTAESIKLIEGRGTGVPTILKQLKQNGDIGQVEKTSVKTSVNDETSSQKSSQKILELMKANPDITTTALAEIIKVSRRAIAKQIAILKEERKLKRVGPDKGGRWEVIDDKSSQEE